MRYLCLIALAAILQGCTAGALDLAKEAPLPQNDGLTTPPWEALVEAGPNAHLDIDFETLNGPVSVAATTTAQPKAPDPSKPQITSVAVPSVKGLKGKGAAELTQSMRSALMKAGWPVVDTPQPDSLSVEGQVLVKPQGANDEVTIIWTVKSPNGKSLGEIKQASEMPKGAVLLGFGEDAQAIAEAGTEGIFDLVAKHQ